MWRPFTHLPTKVPAIFKDPISKFDEENSELSFLVEEQNVQICFPN